jgi:hypothetical protein
VLAVLLGVGLLQAVVSTLLARNINARVRGDFCIVTEFLKIII